jgi:DNA-directed RNA polymerase I, II, and III subunit RPABC2
MSDNYFINSDSEEDDITYKGGKPGENDSEEEPEPEEEANSDDDADAEPAVEGEEEQIENDDNLVKSDEESVSDEENNNEEEENDEDSDIDSEDELDDNEEEIVPTKTKKIKQIPLNIAYNNDEQDDEEEEDGETYLKKFDKDIQSNYIMNFHPECILHNYDEIEALTSVVRDKDGIIIDDLHRTLPYLTKYEKTRILGQRAKQIDSGATAFVKVPENVIDGYLIAVLELQQKRIPFIIRRPLPNGGSEYWNVKDLENISF